MRRLSLIFAVAACAMGALESLAQGGQTGRRVGWAGVTIELPANWHAMRVAVPPGVPTVVDPIARIATASGPISFGRGCGEFPYSFPSTAVALVVLEWTRPTEGVFPRRPARFTAKTLPVHPPPAIECFDGPGGSSEFVDHGRRLDAFLLLGRRAPMALVDQARTVLDTLTVTIDARLTATGIGPVRFGMPKNRAAAALDELFGRPTSRGINTACGARYTEVEWGDLVAEFRSNRFSGYRYLVGGWPLSTPGSPRRSSSRVVSPRMTTSSGVTLGTPLTQLRRRHVSHAGTNAWRSSDGLVFVVGTEHITEIKTGTCGDF